MKTAVRRSRPATTPACSCRDGKPLLIGVFRDGDLVAVTRQHWAGRDRCPMPSEDLDPRVFDGRSAPAGAW